jgi:hypothetical protein
MQPGSHPCFDGARQGKGREPVSRRWFVGVDLGSAHDMTAVAVMERVGWEDWRAVDPGTLEPRRAYTYDVRRVERWGQGISYSTVVEKLVALEAHPKLVSNCEWVVDATGLGAPVCDFLRASGLRGPLLEVVISGGERATFDHGRATVPKAELVGAVALGLEQGELRLAESMPLAGELVRELLMMGAKHTRKGNVQYEAREGHDDMVLAVALAAWRARPRTAEQGWGERWQGPLW